VALPQRARAITQVSNEDVRTHARKEPTFTGGNYKQIRHRMPLEGFGAVAD
jgi:hypothetical protein